MQGKAARLKLFYHRIFANARGPGDDDEQWGGVEDIK
jgi:hypothetical protein